MRLCAPTHTSSVFFEDGFCVFVANAWPLLARGDELLYQAVGTQMAKKKKATQVIRLVSQAGTGYFYTFRKAIKAQAEK